MKRSILLFASIIGSFSFAQTITIDDTLSTNNSMMYYVADSNAVNYDAVAGTAVTWDYSDLAGYNVPPNLDTIIEASTSPFASDFPNSVYCEDFQNGVKTFFRHIGTDLVVDGFVFQESSNDIIVKYDNDSLTALEYPVTVGYSNTDNIDGMANVLSNDVPLTGTATVSADGSGTLLLAGNTYNNVLRIKTEEITSGTLAFPPVTLNVTRTVYAYYDIMNNNMPIFIHGTVLIEASGLGTYGYTAVYSKDPLTAFVGIEDQNTDLAGFSVHPNPTNDFVQVTVPANADKLTVYNALGQIELTIINPSANETLDMSKFEKGVYILEVQKGDSVKTEKVIVK